MVGRIQKLIRLKKLTASGFADQIGVPRSTISHIISGRNNPSLDFVMKILEAFPDVKTDWLLKGEGNMFTIQNSLFTDEDFEEGNDKLSNQKQVVAENAKLGEKLVEEKEIKKGGFPEPLKNIDLNKTSDTAGSSETSSRVMLMYADGTYREYLPRK